MKSFNCVCILIGISLVLTGCSKELSRGAAKKKIQEGALKLGLPFTVGLGTFCYLSHIETLRAWSQRPVMYRNDPVGPFLLAASLEPGGYTTVSEVPNGRCGATFEEYSVQVTSKGEKLKKDWTLTNAGSGGGQIYLAKLADMNVDEITGITSPSDSERTVEFTWKMTPTSQAKAFSVLSDSIVAGDQSSKASFKHYDDGWRYESIVQ